MIGPEINFGKKALYAAKIRKPPTRTSPRYTSTCMLIISKVKKLIASGSRTLKPSKEPVCAMPIQAIRCATDLVNRPMYLK